MPRWTRAVLVGLATIGVVALGLVYPLVARGDAWQSAKWMAPSKRLERTPKESIGAGGLCPLLHQNLAMSRNQSNSPSRAWILIQNRCVCFGHESCNRPNTPTQSTSKNIVQ